MTTAHRPTWHAVLGGENQGGNVTANSVPSVKDMPAQLNLKVRKPSQKLSVSQLPADPYSLKVDSVNLAGAMVLKEALAGLEDLDITSGTEDNRKRQRPQTEISDDSSEGSSDEEDLLRELAAIKAERAKHEAEEEACRLKEEEDQNLKRSVHHNPLLTDVSIKRRWDEEVVFRNQAKLERRPEKRFINDVVRSDFHQKFMGRYIH
eukprot:GHVH01016449.1.p1 GENE.GHVH01016449.1~~GHVH01016449.1.p1  ORF type:complete len:223 (+),score=37.80 GHVH01016449.1:52-669(+)